MERLVSSLRQWFVNPLQHRQSSPPRDPSEKRRPLYCGLSHPEAGGRCT
ncbi:hypothetical protein [Neosynechococcus sphagnicola]|nr:hypothetical protein [Neosynechococcus sphagnicola]